MGKSTDKKMRTAVLLITQYNPGVKTQWLPKAQIHFSLIWTKTLAEEILTSTFTPRRGRKTCLFLAQQVLSSIPAFPQYGHR